MKGRIDSLLEYYEYLVQFDSSQSMLSIGVRIQQYYSDDKRGDIDYWFKTSNEVEYDLETEYDIISTEQGLSLLTYKQFTRDKALSQIIE